MLHRLVFLTVQIIVFSDFVMADNKNHAEESVSRAFEICLRDVETLCAFTDFKANEANLPYYRYDSSVDVPKRIHLRRNVLSAFAYHNNEVKGADTYRSNFKATGIIVKKIGGDIVLTLQTRSFLGYGAKVDDCLWEFYYNEHLQSKLSTKCNAALSDIKMNVTNDLYAALKSQPQLAKFVNLLNMLIAVEFSIFLAVSVTLVKFWKLMKVKDHTKVCTNEDTYKPLLGYETNS